jgi:hypothetical protein
MKIGNTLLAFNVTLQKYGAANHGLSLTCYANTILFLYICNNILFSVSVRQFHVFATFLQFYNVF